MNTFKKRILMVTLALAGVCGFAEEGAVSPAAPAPETEVNLVETAWRLVEINGLEVRPAAPDRVPYMILQEEENLFGGYGGCNRFGGLYELAGERLSFLSIRSTKMACPETMELEARFMRALNQTAGWKISDEKLSLQAEDGSVLATFESFTLAKE